MSKLDKIYDSSPVFVQNLAVSLKGYSNNRERYGRDYREYRRFLKEFDTWSLEKQLAYQQDELVKFVRYAYENSPFYREFYKDVDIQTIKTVDDLKKLPILDKETLRQHIEGISTNPDEPLMHSNTGGTTGKSLTVAMTYRDMKFRMAILDHFKAKVGFEHRKMRRATFNGKHIVPPSQKCKRFSRYNAACKQRIYSSFHITEENMKYYVEDLNRFKPHAIDGFFTSMCEIASYVERHNIQLTFTPKAIFPTSETLTDEGRELLERVFHCKVYNQYASSEGAPFVNDCVDQHLHLELASGVFESLDDDSDEVLVTSFTTHATPLIRYRIGDRMIFDHETKCSCGSPAPMVKCIMGRKLDFLFTAEGARINAGNVSNILKYLPNVVIRSQFVQDRKDEVVLLLEVDKNLYNKSCEHLIQQEFAHKFGENTRLRIQYVDEIPRETSGKLLMIKNNVKE